MAESLRIGIVLGSTRTGRFADRPANWLLEVATARAAGAATFELVDLRDYPMPLFDEPMSPMRGPAKHPVAQRWAAKVRELDGFVFVTGEYNHGIPAALKNAIDYVYAEWNRKPAGYVSYGGGGGTRAIEQLRMNLVEVQVAPIRSAVHIMRGDYMDLVVHGKTFADLPHLDPMAHVMIDDLIWWARTLRAGRAAG